MSRQPTPGKGPSTWEHELLPGDIFKSAKTQAFDALADLFLGDQVDARAGTLPLTVARSAPTSPIPSTSPAVPTLRLVSDSSAAKRIPVPASERTPRKEIAAAPAARIEGLILGHLPVLASAWVMQYARHIAQQETGPIALLRLRSGEGTLEVIGPAAPAVAVEDHRFGSLKEATEHLSGNISAWLIRVEESAEPLLAVLKDIGQLTLLSGADEAATVAAYSAIKRLVPAGEQDTGPSIRLAVMGSPADRGSAGAAKLNRAAESFLKRTIEVTACVGRIAGGSPSVLAWSGRIEAPIEETLRWVCKTARSRPFTPPRAAPANAAPVPAARPEAAAPSVTPPAPKSPVALPPPTPLAIPVPEPVLASAPLQLPLPAAAAPLNRDVAPPPPRPGTLSRHIPALQSLALTCPYATGVELATAEDGTLHLLALEGAAADQPALPRLITAAAWVRDHLPILKLAAPAEGRRISDGEPVLHLLTTSAPTVRRLTESGVRLHVLVSSKTADGPTWVCADLN